MFLTVWRNQVHFFNLFIRERRLAEVTGIGSHRFGLAAQVLLQLLQHGQQLLLVVRVLRNRSRHYDLILTVHGSLRIVRLHETPFCSRRRA